MPRTRIKICGITTEEIAYAAIEAGADALGFVFAPGSPRRITPDQAANIAIGLPPFVTRVALFAGAKLKQVEETLLEDPYFDMIQLHGEEPEPMVRECKGLGVEVMKAIRYREDPKEMEAELRRWNRIHEIEAVLVDGSAGGAGHAFDWKAFATVADALDHPLILAGGLTPENVGEAIRIVQPYAVDVSSGVERERGVKDPELIRAFCDAVREAQ